MYAALKLKDAYSLKGKLWPRAWWAAVHGVTRSQTRLSNFTFSFHLHALEKEMAIHSGVLAWRIPGTGEPGGLPSMGSHRVGQDWSDLAAAAADSILKSRDITLPIKVYLVKAMVFPVVMYVYENWTVKKAEPQGTVALNCGVGEYSRESLGLQGDPTSPS